MLSGSLDYLSIAEDQTISIPPGGVFFVGPHGEGTGLAELGEGEQLESIDGSYESAIQVRLGAALERADHRQGELVSNPLGFRRTSR